MNPMAMKTKIYNVYTNNKIYNVYTFFTVLANS